MSIQIQLESGYVFSAETITLAKLNLMFTNGRGIVISGTFTTTDIADEAITVGKMADLARGSILAGTGATNRPTALDMTTSGCIVIGQGAGADLVIHVLSGDATMTADGVVTISNAAISLAKMADLAQGSMIIGGTSNRPEALDIKAAGAIGVGQGAGVTPLARVIASSATSDFGIDSAGLGTLNAAHARQVSIIPVGGDAAGSLPWGFYQSAADAPLTTDRQPLFVRPDVNVTLISIGYFTGYIGGANNVTINVYKSDLSSIVSYGATAVSAFTFADLGALNNTSITAADPVFYTIQYSAAQNISAALVVVYEPTNA